MPLSSLAPTTEGIKKSVLIIGSSNLTAQGLFSNIEASLLLKIDNEGFPVQPYGVKDNPNSVLDIADIVYVNPVNTGYSRVVEDKDG